MTGNGKLSLSPTTPAGDKRKKKRRRRLCENGKQVNHKTHTAAAIWMNGSRLETSRLGIAIVQHICTRPPTPPLLNDLCLTSGAAAEWGSGFISPAILLTKYIDSSSSCLPVHFSLAYLCIYPWLYSLSAIASHVRSLGLNGKTTRFPMRGLILLSVYLV